MDPIHIYRAQIKLLN